MSDEALAMYAPTSAPLTDRRPLIWGLPLAPWTREQAADAVMALVGSGGPSYFITANVHYAMLSERDPALRAINERAAFLLADGAPLVWASRYGTAPLPERVAGSDLIYDLCERSAARGLGIFLLGGEPCVAEAAGRRLEILYPGLRIVGIEAPPFRAPTPGEHEALLHRIRRAAPDLLFVAFGQPKGEYWLSENLPALGDVVGVQVGASLDFVAGRIPRAPRLVQKIGMEWGYRMWREPSRLAPRYARNAAFILRSLARDARHAGKAPSPEAAR
jgi:N-acetylglucosaminyldiphosphoundecaprenol N-acetyl-beta-D-mannosaminyltransferase